MRIAFENHLTIASKRLGKQFLILEFINELYQKYSAHTSSVVSSRL